MPQFHAEVTRDGAGWLIHVRELEQAMVLTNRSEIYARVCELIASETELPTDQIDIVMRSERDSVRRRARQLGFETTLSGHVRSDTFAQPGKTRSVVVRYDDFGAVVDIDATTQLTDFQPTLDGALDALFFTAQYSDIRRRHIGEAGPATGR